LNFEEPAWAEHNEKVTKHLESKKMVLRAASLPEEKEDPDFKSSNSTFMVFAARDEREAHFFMLSDPLYKE
jgi:hypothetical protein